jgi:hypothetical protein
VIGGREPGHVQARLGNDRPGESEADAGDICEPLCGRQQQMKKYSTANTGLINGTLILVYILAALINFLPGSE